MGTQGFDGGMWAGDTICQQSMQLSLFLAMSLLIPGQKTAAWAGLDIREALDERHEAAGGLHCVRQVGLPPGCLSGWLHQLPRDLHCAASRVGMIVTGHRLSMGTHPEQADWGAVGHRPPLCMSSRDTMWQRRVQKHQPGQRLSCMVPCHHACHRTRPRCWRYWSWWLLGGVRWHQWLVCSCQECVWCWSTSAAFSAWGGTSVGCLCRQGPCLSEFWPEVCGRWQ